MTCDERQDLILLYAAGALEPAEQQELRRHLTGGCTRCAASLAEAEATLAHLPLALEPHAPSPAARERLMRRIDAAPAAARPAPLRRWVGYAIAACLGLAIGAAGWQMLRDGQRQRQIAQLQAALADRDAKLGGLVSAIGANQLSLVQFDPADPQPQARGRILWDRQHSRWHVWVFDMKPPPPGREYELWFITPDQKKIPGGTFTVDAQGRGSMIAPVPADIGPIALAAITDEPIGGVAVPTGAVQLSGKVE